MLDMVRHDDEAEFVNYFPQWTDLAISVRNDYELVVCQLDSVLDQFTNLDPREFASKFRYFTWFFVILFFLFSF
jgi:hypothetical protein